ncbi:hypothetical protein ACF1BS_03440 [Streptomyces sp. NPDC014748]|uniref:hypothetical protein n=1 Tax=Streptomyces sp. NPDC014748 TaxID=3364905 RepID=UPI0036FE9153
MTAAPVEKKINGHSPGYDPRALAEAEAIRARAAAEVEAKRIEAEGKAEAEKIKAAEEAEKQRIANERAVMRLEKERAEHQAYLARKQAEAAKARVEQEKTEQAAEEEAGREAQQLAEQERAEFWWKWGARGIYAVGLVIAAPVQFMHFWDRQRPFLVAAPGLLEGLAIVLAFGATWAVAHRRDVAPYRIGIMISAVIAAALNLYGGRDPRIGFNAGLIGAIASLGGPIVLMAYEHGIAQKADGIPSWRERRATERKAAEEKKAREKARRDKADAEAAAARAKDIAEARAREEQKRRDADRQQHHPEVWKVAEAMRSARGSAVVTEQIWADAWYRVTGSKTVGITPEIEELTQAAQWRMRAVTDAPISGDFALVESQIKRRQKGDPEAPDGRRNNGGTPPVRRPGDTQPYSQGARRQIGVETASRQPEGATE